MGQKANPIGLRLGINRGWDSIWFAKKREYGKFLMEDYKIRNYIKKKCCKFWSFSSNNRENCKKVYCFYLYIKTGICYWKKGSRY